MREVYIEVGGGPLAYDDYAGDGPPMVLLHGIGGAKLNWMQLAPLLEPGHHLYALDMPGFGRSPLAGRRTGPRANAEVAREFIERVAGAPAVVVGHSMGGLTSILLAAAHPDAVGAMVLLDPAFPEEPGDEPERSPAEATPRWLLDVFARVPRAASLLTPLVVRARDLERIVRGTIVNASGPGATIPEMVLRAHVDHERARQRTGRPYEGYLRAWRDVGEVFGRPAELESRVAAITAPVLLLHGTADPVVPPSAARRLASLRPDWRFDWLDGVGHQPLFETPDQVARIVRGWLAGTGVGGSLAPGSPPTL